MVPLCGHCVNRNKKRCEIISELGPTRKWCLSSVDKLSLPRPSTSHAKGLLLYCFVCIANVLPLQWPAIGAVMSHYSALDPRPSTLGFCNRTGLKDPPRTRTHTRMCQVRMAIGKSGFSGGPRIPTTNFVPSTV